MIVRQALRGHDADPLGPPVELAKLEQFKLWKATLPNRCGAYEGDNIYLPRWLEREVLPVVVQHERSHGWCCRRGETDATEGDVWLLTFLFAWPPWCRDRTPPGYPEWFLDAVLLSEFQQ